MDPSLISSQQISPHGHTFRRRQFIAAAGFTALSALLSETPLKAAHSAASKRILIVGAGASGLAAAQRLRTAGFHPVILEARERLGGRVWTDSNGFDLGASWIHGQRGNPLTKLAKQANAATFAFDYDNYKAYHASGAVDTKTTQQIDRHYASLERLISQSQRTAPPSLPLSRTVDAFLTTLPPSDRAGLRHAVNTRIIHEYAADPSDLSLKYFDHGEEEHGGDLVLPSGFSNLLSPLQNAAEIHLGHVVQHIDWSGEKIVIRTNQGTFSAASAIITLPLGVLKSGQVRFHPMLPERHRLAIQRLGFGTLNKLFVRFPKLAWPRDPHVFQFIGQGLWETWVNLFPILGQPVLVGFNGGRLAQRIENHSLPQLCASALGVLRQMFGPTLLEPEQIITTRWKQDPFSLGSYSSYAPGSSPQDRSALATPVSSRLVFAGEACSSQWPSTVHGALLSGENAADFLLNQ